MSLILSGHAPCAMRCRCGAPSGLLQAASRGTAHSSSSSPPRRNIKSNRRLCCPCRHQGAAPGRPTLACAAHTSSSDRRVRATWLLDTNDVLRLTWLLRRLLALLRRPGAPSDCMYSGSGEKLPPRHSASCSSECVGVRGVAARLPALPAPLCRRASDRNCGSGGSGLPASLWSPLPTPLPLRATFSAPAPVVQASDAERLVPLRMCTRVGVPCTKPAGSGSDTAACAARGCTHKTGAVPACTSERGCAKPQAVVVSVLAHAACSQEHSGDAAVAPHPSQSHRSCKLARRICTSFPLSDIGRCHRHACVSSCLPSAMLRPLRPELPPRPAVGTPCLCSFVSHDTSDDDMPRSDAASAERGGARPRDSLARAACPGSQLSGVRRLPMEPLTCSQGGASPSPVLYGSSRGRAAAAVSGEPAAAAASWQPACPQQSSDSLAAPAASTIASRSIPATGDGTEVAPWSVDMRRTVPPSTPGSMMSECAATQRSRSLLLRPSAHAVVGRAVRRPSRAWWWFW
mmetsp:Transcript_28398/g.84093  ORF Transcript_28398/g.84093 Transcript_28398/m.84093 type:complete len:516 (-) Transcript_28398:610-2157(-)